MRFKSPPPVSKRRKDIFITRKIPETRYKSRNFFKTVYNFFLTIGKKWVKKI